MVLLSSNHVSYLSKFLKLSWAATKSAAQSGMVREGVAVTMKASMLTLHARRTV